MSPDLSSLPRFPLSVVLSYLQQQPPYRFKDSSQTYWLPHNRDAIALLLTTRRFTHTILPLFRVPRKVCRNYQHQAKDGTLITVIEKYRFVVYPIQDPRTLLDRLNTRRLKARITWLKKLIDAHYFETDETDGDIETTFGQSCTHNDSKNKYHDGSKETEKYYKFGRTIEELALEEWSSMKINHANDMVVDGTVDGNCAKWRIWPAEMELLRFLDPSFEKGHDKAQDQERKINSQRRIFPSPFCFQSTSNKHNKQRTDKIERAIINNNLMGGLIPGDGVSLLASYPRSGNTLLRTLLERITSTVTGSDTRPDRTLSKSLALDHDLVGEGLVGSYYPSSTISLDHRSFDPLVNIVKTHFPERKGWRYVDGNRVLLLVRNPYDAIDSYWNLCCTNTHTRTLEESVYIKYSQKFEAMARHEIEIWCEFHYYWFDICEKEGVPLLIVRYEDLVLNVESEMMRIIKFILGKHCNEEDGSKIDSFWEWRIRHAIGNASAQTSSEKKPLNKSFIPICNLGSYKPRSFSGGLSSVGKSIHKKRYTDSVLLHMHEVAVSLELKRGKKYAPTRRQQNNMTILQRFGYDIYTQQFPQNFNNPPSFSLRNDPPKKHGSLVINNTPEIRSKDDPYGRAMTYWRRGETNDDTIPFPVVQ
ncbi:hypothetical protein ACHAXA_002453 [Cyclostephanos tholiformis]|uniref:Sulfotransferase domain-containing protein n=1 Tax=Cyclostephanos tholiformis TaxID=382380 RepID=A0ABD3RCC4_9STRA